MVSWNRGDVASRIRNTLLWSPVTLTREIILPYSEQSGLHGASLANAMPMALCTESSTETWIQKNLLSSEAGGKSIFLLGSF
jgi:hypothetical protein